MLLHYFSDLEKKNREILAALQYKALYNTGQNFLKTCVCAATAAAAEADGGGDSDGQRSEISRVSIR